MRFKNGFGPVFFTHRIRFRTISGFLSKFAGQIVHRIFPHLTDTPRQNRTLPDWIVLVPALMAPMLSSIGYNSGGINGLSNSLLNVTESGPTEAC